MTTPTAQPSRADRLRVVAWPAIATLVIAVVFALGSTVRDTLFSPGCDQLAGKIAASNGGGTGSCQP